MVAINRGGSLGYLLYSMLYYVMSSKPYLLGPGGNLNICQLAFMLNCICQSNMECSLTSVYLYHITLTSRICYISRVYRSTWNAASPCICTMYHVSVPYNTDMQDSLCAMYVPGLHHQQHVCVLYTQWLVSLYTHAGRYGPCIWMSAENNSVSSYG